MIKQSYREEFIEKANKVHKGLYDYSMVEYVNAHTPVVIICPIHGEFMQKPVVHYNHGAGCQKCGGGTKSNSGDFIKKAMEVHGDLYDYSKVNYVNNLTPVTIVCKEHGEFEQLPKTHKRGQGCPQCKGGLPDNTLSFIKKAKKMYGTLYDYSDVDYISSQSMVTIKCRKHGEFKKRPNGHLMGQGCPKCGDERLRDSKRLSLKTLILRFKEVHGERYDYTLVERHGNINNDKVKIKCSEHGIFEKTPVNHMAGQGCPKCSQGQTSKGEKEIADYVGTLLPIKRNVRTLIYPFELDIFVESIGVAIEYCGLRWHGEDVGGKKRSYHKEKMNACNKKGIRLITIFEDEWILHPYIVKARICHILGMYACRVYARQCRVVELDQVNTKEFLNRYHIQGYVPARVRLGLEYNKDLVAVMTFKSPGIYSGKRDHGDEYELSRFCSSMSVVGGASKLLKHFETNVTWSKLITYADLRWSNGELYDILGFTQLHRTPPNYWYFKQVRDGRKHRYALRKGVVEGDDLTLTEWENRKNQGWDRIWDCGNLVFEKYNQP